MEMHDKEPNLKPRPLELREQNPERDQLIADEIQSLLEIVEFRNQIMTGKESSTPKLDLKVMGPSTYLSGESKIPIEIHNANLFVQRVPSVDDSKTYSLQLRSNGSNEITARANGTVDRRGNVTEMQLWDMPSMNRINWNDLLAATTTKIGEDISKKLPLV